MRTKSVSGRKKIGMNSMKKDEQCIPLDACLQFGNSTMTSFVQNIEKSPTTYTITFNLQNELVKRW